MPFYDSVFRKLCDGKLRSEDGRTFKVHKIILAMKSQFFRLMFCENNENIEELVIPDVNGKFLSDILGYIYTGEISITERNIKSLMVAEDFLLIDGIHLQIEQSLRNIVNVGNCVNLFHAACRLNKDGIYKILFRFIETNFEEIMRSQANEITELPRKQLENILRSHSLYVYRETTVWTAIKEWIQKGNSTRLHYVPQLLMCLAGRELEENLATEILEHEIVSKNFFMKDLNEVKRCSEFTNHFETLLQLFLEDQSRFLRHLGPYRIPKHLNAISSYNDNISDDDGYGKCTLFVTYDENIDLWRRIGQSEDQFEPRFITVVGHYVYLFDLSRCRKFDLIDEEWMRMRNFRNDFLGNISVVAVDGGIYLIGDVALELGATHGVKMEVYHAENDRWLDGGLLSNVYFPVSATIDKKIYVVGRTWNSDGITAGTFDTATENWTRLPSPRSTYPDSIVSLVAYQKKLCLVGVANVEVLDPETNMWRDIPHLPCTSRFTTAVVWNDDIIVYDDLCGKGEAEGFRWNDARKGWEVLEIRIPLKEFKNLRFSIVNDVDTIRFITKANRDPRTHLRKSLFNV